MEHVADNLLLRGNLLGVPDSTDGVGAGLHACYLHGWEKRVELDVVRWEAVGSFADLHGVTLASQFLSSSSSSSFPSLM